MSSVELTVVTQPSIVAEIRCSYPNVHTLLEYNPKGTLKVLIKAEALECERYRGKIYHSQNCNQRTWSDNKLKIEEYLSEINNDEHLREARESVAEVIHGEHYRAHPYWPAVGEAQESYIKIYESETYSCVNKEIFWSVLGYITVRDRRRCTREEVTAGVIATILALGIANTTERTYKYLPECFGKPTMKVVINRKQMKRVEALVREDVQKAKENVDKFLGKLTWESLNLLENRS